jgi:hypothetical protein
MLGRIARFDEKGKWWIKKGIPHFLPRVKSTTACSFISKTVLSLKDAKIEKNKKIIDSASGMSKNDFLSAFKRSKNYDTSESEYEEKGK